MMFCRIFSLLVMTLFTGQMSAGINDGVTALDLNSDGSQYATGHDDGTVRIWDAATNQLLVSVPRPQFSWMSPIVQFFVNDVAFWPDGQRLAVSFGGDNALGLVRILDATTGQTIAESALGAVSGALDWSPDGNRLAVLAGIGTGLGESASLYILDRTATELNHLDLDQPSIVSVDWSPEGSSIAHTNGATAVVWDATLWSKQELARHQGIVTAVAWNFDGSKLATTDEFTVRIWDTATGQQQEVFQKSDFDLGISRIAWSPDGVYVASTADNLLEAWNVETGLPAFTIDMGYAHGLIWRDDGTLLYSSGTVKTLNLEPFLLPPIGAPTQTPSRCPNTEK